MGGRGHMSFEDAMDFAEDLDLPDGAFWAMAHEMAGLEYGDGFDLIAGGKGSGTPGYLQEPAFKLAKNLRAKIEKYGAVKNNDRYHWQVRNTSNNSVIADWWPHKKQWRFPGRKMTRGDENAFLNALAKGADQ